MLDKVTRETFEPIKGAVFELVLGEEQTLFLLELSAVLGTGLQGDGEPGAVLAALPRSGHTRTAAAHLQPASSPARRPRRSFWSRSAATPTG